MLTDVFILSDCEVRVGIKQITKKNILYIFSLDYLNYSLPMTVTVLELQVDQPQVLPQPFQLHQCPQYHLVDIQPPDQQ